MRRRGIVAREIHQRRVSGFLAKRAKLLDIEPTARSSALIFGGYLGDSTEEWLTARKFGKIHVFEPVAEFANKIEFRFRGQPVCIHQHGISKHSSSRAFFLGGDSTAEVSADLIGRADHALTPVSFSSAQELAVHLGEEVIGLLECNIEGGEYELFPALAETEILRRCEYVLIQFHSVSRSLFTNMLEVRRVRNLLNLNHSPVWSYPYVWELWRLSK